MEPHTPVLLSQALTYLKCSAGMVIADCTLGYGGHAEEILKIIGHDGLLIGFDQDREALDFAKERLTELNKKIILINKNFRDIKTVLREKGITSVDGALFDLGVSSRQLEDAERGFSFLINGPIDMRMDKNIKTDACELLNNLPEKKLKKIIYEYGEEKWASRIAKSITAARERERISTTLHLAEVVSSAIPKRFHPAHIHPATRTFQALRIAVNDELNVLKTGIDEAVDLLNTGGRICVISFHSLEDRIVKTSFREYAKGCICRPDVPQCICNKKKRLDIVTKRPVTASVQEVQQNHRARSAKLRVAEKIKGI